MRHTLAKGGARALRIVLSVTVVAATATVLLAAPLSAQQDEPSGPQIEEVDQDIGTIIPRPNSGIAPADAADRGGALQLMLLGLIVAFFALAVFSIRRSGQKARVSRTP